MIVLRFGIRTLLATAGLLMLMHCANPYIRFLGFVLLTYNAYKIGVD